MRIVWILGAAVLLVASPLAAKPVEKNYHETFDVTQGVTLRLEHGDGNVTITPWDQDVIEVDVVYRADEHRWGFGDNSEFEVLFAQKSDVVHVRERPRDGIRVGVQTTVDRFYEYSIRAPAYTILDLRGDDADVEVESWEANAEFVLDDGRLTVDGLTAGKLEVGLEDGDVRLEDVRADLTLSVDDADIRIVGCTLGVATIEMEDGDLSVRESSGEFDVELDDGDVDFDAVRVARLRVRAQDGNLSFDAYSVERLDWDIRTDDGDVQVVLEDGMSVTFEIDTGDGRIDLDLTEPADLRESRRHASGTLHGGGGALRIRTQDGEVRLRQKG